VRARLSDLKWLAWLCGAAAVALGVDWAVAGDQWWLPPTLIGVAGSIVRHRYPEPEPEPLDIVIRDFTPPEPRDQVELRKGTFIR
jgi:hypothetical protein